MLGSQQVAQCDPMIQPIGSEPARVGERKHPLNVPGWKLEMKAAVVIDSSSPAEEPIRTELFGIERLEQHAETPAAYRNVAETVLARHEITPAAGHLAGYPRVQGLA
jgi:hypothetical protein